MRCVNPAIRERRRADAASDFNLFGALALTFANPFVWLLWATAYRLAGGVS